jgi:hypothetical protein
MEYVGGGEGVARRLSARDSSRRAWRFAIAAVRCKQRNVVSPDSWRRRGGAITWSSALFALSTARRSWQSPSWPLENLKAARISLSDGDVVCGEEGQHTKRRERGRERDGYLFEDSPGGIDEVVGVGGRVHGEGGEECGEGGVG